MILNISDLVEIKNMERYAPVGFHKMKFIRIGPEPPDIDPIYLVSGWRRTGKNTLALQFNGVSMIDWNWKVYARPDISEPLVIQKIEEIAFATELKKDVLWLLGLDSDTDTESIKEEIMEDGKTFRQHLIDVGADGRKKHINHWCVRAFESINSKLPVMFTDWRFLNEHSYSETRGKTITIRIFRSEVDIPASDIESEHQLDKFETDYLLVLDKNHQEEFAKVCNLLPQFGKYKLSSHKFL